MATDINTQNIQNAPLQGETSSVERGASETATRSSHDVTYVDIKNGEKPDAARILKSNPEFAKDPNKLTELIGKFVSGLERDSRSLKTAMQLTEGLSANDITVV